MLRVLVLRRRGVLLLLFLLVATLFFVLADGSSSDGSKAAAADANEEEHDDDEKKKKRISIQDMSCDYFEQPLNHFDLPRDRSPTYTQRYCTYDKYSSAVAAGSSNKKNESTTTNTPVFFYTGNESPLNEYINNTGLIWELAQSFHALVVFVEHRYEGKSLPNPSLPNCMAYSSSIQALADYANFIEKKLFKASTTTGSLIRRPVIAFGGSYGGMLSAWLRMKYPHLVAGAIAGSAPIWGFPRNFPTKIDSAHQVIKRGLDLPYPPTAPKTENNNSNNNHCVSNLLAAWPLMKVLGNSSEGRGLLSKSFKLCNDLVEEKEADLLIRWGQSPWFDLAEGSFPYPSGYIVYALTHNDKAKLPAWPLQAACWNVSKLHQDFGILFEGNVSNVNHTIHYGDSNLAIEVDWDKATAVSNNKELFSSLSASRTITGLLTSVRDAVSIWFNVTKDVKCYNLTAAPSASSLLGLQRNSFHNKRMRSGAPRSQALTLFSSDVSSGQRFLRNDDKNRTSQCFDRMSQTGSWPSLCCNEEMNLIITEARGLGRDFLWPPMSSGGGYLPRGTTSHADVLRSWNTSELYSFCKDPEGIFGYPHSPPDPWATSFDTLYGGARIEAHSNIVFSNGLLDPWSAAGVYRHGMDPTNWAMVGGDNKNNNTGMMCPVPGLCVQQLGRGSIALVMEYGGHHTDLMYSSIHDPPSITAARKIESSKIDSWIKEWQKHASSSAG